MENTLRKLQLTQLEMLKVVDAFCKENDIQYSLYAGTLLGAVRHQGFIPWDDDLDICMSRENYNRFIELWTKDCPSGYIIQNKENTPEFTQSFTKIRKENTTFLQYEWEREKYHTGIFIDIFPIDRIPDKGLRLMMYKLHCMIYQLYTREFVPSKSNKVVQLVSGILLKLNSHNSRMIKRQKLLKKITVYNHNDSLKTVGIETVGSLKKHFSKNMLGGYTYLKFEDGDFMCFADWDEHLKCKFKHNA